MNENNSKETNNSIKSSLSIAKRGGKVAIKGGKAIVKSLGKIIIVPTIAIFLCVVLLVSLADTAYFGTTGQRGVYDKEKGQNNTLMTVTDNEGTSIEVAKEQEDVNKIKEKYYNFYSIQSYYKVLPGENEPISFTGDTDNFLRVQDYENKEANFYLSSSFLMSLNDLVHQDKFVYPEQFTKPVAYDKTNGTLLSLTDEEGEPIAKSNAFDTDGKKTNNLTEGFWNYGFGPVLYYIEADRTVWVKGNYTAKDVVLGEEVIQEPYSGEFCYQVPDSMMKEEDKKIYLIEKGITYSGTLTYTYEEGDRHIGGLYNGATTPEKGYINCTKEKYGEHTIVHHFTDENGEDHTWTETIPLYYYREGGVYEKMPILQGETFDSCNNKYYNDYLDAYKTYVPKKIMENFNIEERLKEDSETLKLFNKLNTLELLDNTYANRIKQFNIGDNAVFYTESVPESVNEYKSLAEEYGSKYGIEPNLILAIIAVESGGDPNQKTGDAKGLMQIIKQGDVVCHNNGIAYTVSFPKDPFNVRDNIDFGTAYLKNCFEAYEGNMSLGIQAYNYGSQHLAKTLQNYEYNGLKGKGTNEEKIYLMKLENDTGWFDFLREKSGRTTLYVEKVSAKLGIGADEVGVTEINAASPYNTVEATKAFYSSRRQRSFLDKARDYSESFLSKTQSFFALLFGTEEDSTEYEEYSYPVPGEDKINVLVQTYAYEHMVSHSAAYKDIMAIRKGEMEEFGGYYIATGGVASTATKTVHRWSPILADIIGCNPTKEKYNVSSHIGPRKVKDCPEASKWHCGTDYGMGVGTHLYAIADGEVTEVYRNSARGIYVTIQTEEGIKIRCQHMNKAAVQIGQRVSVGDYIGESGDTGVGTGAHLHIEIFDEGGYYNPEEYIYK